MESIERICNNNKMEYLQIQLQAIRASDTYGGSTVYMLEFLETEGSFECRSVPELAARIKEVIEQHQPTTAKFNLRIQEPQGAGILWNDSGSPLLNRPLSTAEMDTLYDCLEQKIGLPYSSATKQE